MTHPTYTQQALSRYDLPRLKRIATELGITPTLDKRGADTWINAILTHQSTQLQKTQSIPPEKLTTVEISFYDHEIYAASKLIATITYDDNLTQPWLVVVNGVEQFRANTWARCHRFIQWHHQDGTLNEAAQTETPCPTENRIMAHIFKECQNYDFALLDDGIYHNDVKLGSVGCTDGNWWVKRGCSSQQYCNSVMDAVRTLSMMDTLPMPKWLTTKNC